LGANGPAGDHRVSDYCRYAARECISLPLPRLSIFTHGPFSGRLIFGSVLVEIAIILLIIYTGLGNSFLGTRRLFAIPFALAMLAMEEPEVAHARRSVRRRSRG
jgi:hypothetical protein